MCFEIRMEKLMKNVWKFQIWASKNLPKSWKKCLNNRGTNKIENLYVFQLVLKKFSICRPLILSLWPVFHEVFIKIDFEASTEFNFKTLPQNLLKILPNPWKNQRKKHVVFGHRIFHVFVSILDDLGLHKEGQICLLADFWLSWPHLGCPFGPLGSTFANFWSNYGKSDRVGANLKGVSEPQNGNLEGLEAY